MSVCCRAVSAIASVMRGGCGLRHVAVAVVAVGVGMAAYAQAGGDRPGDIRMAKGVEATEVKRVDSLLRVLDEAIGHRDVYLKERKRKIEGLKRELGALRSEREIYEKNGEIINAYESFVCDSAKEYLHRNLAIAQRLRNADWMNESRLRLGLVYSMSGSFLQARDYFDSVDYNSLPNYIKALYGWAQLKYYTNLILSTDEVALKEKYRMESLGWRDSLITLFGEDTEFGRKEMAGRYKELGDYRSAIEIYGGIISKVDPASHDYAMLSKGLADLYERSGDVGKYKYYLLVSAIGDTRLGVKENESLLSLAELLYSEGDVNRAYRYMHAALEDANYYNSRFKNAQIARLYPIVELSYLERLTAQRKRMTLYLCCMGVLAIIIGVVALLFYKQTRVVSRSRLQLAEANSRLKRTYDKLAEANIIRERYVGYFMQQCSLNVNKLDEFRLNVNRKIKAKQIDDLFVMSSRPLEKELEELYANFDKAFLNLYPDFLEEFNNQLQPDCRFTPPTGRLNTPLRIFALIRLGITDMTQIANFLHYSVQTVYNYKSKVRKMSVLSPEEFEAKVKKLGTLAATEG